MHGTELREWREGRGWSQREAAERLGCSYSAISRWENGNRRNAFLGAAVRELEAKLGPAPTPAETPQESPRKAKSRKGHR